MKERNMTISLAQARDWFNSGNKQLQELALQVFDIDELVDDFRGITTFKKACEVLGYNYYHMVDIDKTFLSRSTSAMFRLNIVRRALNFGQNLQFAKNSKDNHFYYPTNPLITVDSTYCREQLNLGNLEIIGKIEVKGKLYNVLNSFTYYDTSEGLSCFNGALGRCSADANVGFFGCANSDIAKHFGKYFGMLITVAKYADIIKDFEVIESKYII